MNPNTKRVDVPNRPGSARRILRAFTNALLLPVVLASCWNPVDPGTSAGTDGQTSAEETLAALQGEWVATENVAFYGRTLTNTLELDVSDENISLGVTVRDGSEVLNALTVTGTVTPDADSAEFAYTGGTQAADNGDGTLDPATHVDLGADDLAELSADLGGTRTVAFSGSTFTLDAGTQRELVFEKQ